MPLGLTGALLIGAAAPVAGKAVGNAIRGKKSDYDKYNIKEIGKLKRMREMDALGLTDEERRMMRSQFDSQILQTQSEGEQRRRQLMASGDAGGGMALQQAALADTGSLAARTAAVDAINQADYEKEQQQRQELENRMAQEGQRQMQKQERRAQLAEVGLEQAGEFYTQKRKIGGAKNPAVAKAIGSQYGITDPKEQAQFAEYIALNPQMAGPLSSSLKK